MKNKVSNILGWIGVLLVLGAYALVSFNVLTPKDVLYQVLNILGAFGIVVETYSKKDYQPFWLNLIWLLIALVALVRLA